MIHTRILNKIDTYDKWEEEDPILLNGELGFARKEDKVIVKIGDGNSSYSSLSSFELVPENSVVLPSGIIMLWSGAETAIPNGWLLCDGTNGTPDLRDKFVVGAGNGYSVGDEGGEARHVLTKDEMPSHSHAIKSDIDNSAYNQTWPAWTEYTTGWTQQANSTKTAPTYTQTTGSDQAHNNLPPYYALCYIMKN